MASSMGVLLCCALALAPVDDEPPAESAGQGVARGGITLDAAWYQDALRVVSGGAERGWARSRLAEVIVGFDLHELAGMEGASAEVSGYATGGRGTTAAAGDIQTASNIEGPRRGILASAWFEQLLGGESLRLRLGKFDANSEFAVVEHAGDFLNSSFGYSPTVLPMPTFPDPAWGATAEWRVLDGLSLKVGAFDGATQQGRDTGTHGVSSVWDAPSASFTAVELATRWGEDHAGRLALGHWRHDGHFPRFDSGVDRGTDGSYLVLEQELWSRSGAERRRESLAAFLQLGRADADLAAMRAHLGGGLLWDGLLPGHAVGLGATRVDLSDRPGAGFGADHELAIEGFWRWQVSPRWELKPDVQYIVHPGGGALDDTLIAGARITWRL